jgi:tetratricopeptide (TPR) repeat protein
MTGLSFSKGCISLNCVLRGDLEAANASSTESLRIAQEIGGLLALALGHTAYGTSCYARGLFDESERHLREGLEFSERVTQAILVFFAPLWLGLLYSDIGQNLKAERYFEKGILSLKNSQIFPSMINIFEVARARERVLNGDHDVRIEELAAYREGIRFKAFQGLVMRHIGETLLHLGGRHLADAEEWLTGAVRIDTASGMRWFVAGHHGALADLHRRTGDEKRAAESLRMAIQTLKECKAHGWIRRTMERSGAEPTAGTTV